jgi:membrane protein
LEALPAAIIRFTVMTSPVQGDGRGERRRDAQGDRTADAPSAGARARRPSRWYRPVVDYAIDLFNKFANDCTMSLVGMVAFNVLTSFVSLILGVVLLLALVPGTAHEIHNFAAQINRILPADVRKDANVEGLLNSIHSASGALTAITAIGLLWGGSNLFSAIEGAFAFVYRVKTRDIVPQKVLSVLMIVLFAVLLPLSFVSSLLLGAATTTLGRILPVLVNEWLTAGLGLATGLFSLFLLFLVIYIVMPNRPIAWRHSWRGALAAALAMWVVNTAFPFYAAHFIGTRQYGAATIGTVIITITWVWLFSLVLLLGSQINALSMGIAPWKYDLTRILMDQQGPLQPIRHPHEPRQGHRGLPFSGLVHDSYKFRHAHGQRESGGHGAADDKQPPP